MICGIFFVRDQQTVLKTMQSQITVHTTDEKTLGTEHAS